jgi:hypothetical protein
MKKITKAASIVLYLLMAISAVLVVLVFAGGTVAGDPAETPVNLDYILNFSIFMVAGAAVMTLLFELINIFLHPANAKMTLLSLVGIAVILGVAYMLSDGTPLRIMGYEGSDNVPSMLKLTDTGLYTFYLLFGVAAFSIVATEVSRIFK